MALDGWLWLVSVFGRWGGGWFRAASVGAIGGVGVFGISVMLAGGLRMVLLVEGFWDGLLIYRLISRLINCLG